MPKKIFTDKMPIKQVVGFHIDTSEYNIPHNHEYFEFSLTKKGSILHIINNKKYVVEKKQIILLAPENMHRTKNNNKNGAYELLDLQVEMETFKNVCQTMGEGIYEKILSSTPYCFRLNDFSIMSINEYIEKAQHYDYFDSRRRLIMISVLYFVVSELVRNLFWERQYGEQQLPKAIELFFEQLTQKENIGKSFAEICKNIPYHKTHILRVFKQKGMENPNKILVAHKMKYAANLLLTTEMKVVDICNEIGYGSVAYFNKIFKITYKCTPREYRKTKGLVDNIKINNKR